MTAVSARIRFGAAPSPIRPAVFRGDALRVFCDFFDQTTLAAVDVAAVTVRAWDASGTLVAPAPTATEVAPGTWQADITPTNPGVWQVEFACATPSAAVDVRQIDVRAPEPVPTYVGPQPVTAVAGRTGNIVLLAEDVGYVAGAETVTVQQAIADTQGAVSGGVVRAATLAALTATSASVGALGEVYAEPANDGSYRRASGAWVLVSRATIPALDSRATVLEQQIQPADAYLVGFADPLGDVVAFRADTLDGAMRMIGFDAPAIIARDDGSAETPFLQVVDAAGYAVAFRVDGQGALRALGQAEPTTIVSDDGSADTPFLRVVDAVGAAVAFRVDSQGALRMLGSPEPSAQDDPADARYYGLTGSGDESAALMAAHNAARVAGIRVLDFGDLQVTAPSATDLGDVIFTGQRQLVGTYRKRVIPPTAQSLIPRSGIVPARHLPAMAAAASPVVAFLGDSITQASDSMSMPLTSLWGAIRMEISRQNRHKAFTFHNRGIGGTAWITATTYPVVQLPAWYTNPTRNWLEYLRDLAPDVVVIAFGMNDENNEILPNMVSVLGTLAGFAKRPDILLVTPPVPTLQGAQGVRIAQEKRDANAGIERTYAARHDIGLIDAHRVFCAARDGFDLYGQQFIRVANADQAITLPWTMPQECTDFVLDVRNGAGLNGYAAGGAIITCTLSPQPGNDISLRISGGLWQYRVRSSGSREQVAWTNTALASIDRIAITATSEGWVTVWLSDQPVYEGWVERFGGLFTPRLGRDGDETPFSATMMHAAIGVPRIVRPSCIDDDIYRITAAERPSNNTFDGASPNHASAQGIANIHVLAAQASDFRV